MKQLSLFDDEPAEEVRAPDPEVPAPGMQLDLFADRMLLLVQARSALASLDPEGARRAARVSLARYPGDAQLAEELGKIDGLAWQIDKALRRWPDERPAALVGVAEQIEPLRRGNVRRAPSGPFPGQAVWTALLQRAAAEAVGRTGDLGLVAGAFEPGWLFMLAGDMESARASSSRAIQAGGGTRCRALLGEIARREGDLALARQLFFEALRDNPYDVPAGVIGDEDAIGLAEMCRLRFEIEEEPAAWSAAAGAVIGLFHLQMFSGEEAVDVARLRESLDAARLEALSRADAFLAALAASRSRGDVLGARRTMKRLQPSLFEVVMGRAPH